MWTLIKAVDFVSSLNAQLVEVGYSVGLTGSVLFKGQSDSDLDILIYPLSKVDKKQDEVRSCLINLGFHLVADRNKVTSIWRKKGSEDTKHVEVWKYQDKRIDIFFVE